MAMIDAYLPKSEETNDDQKITQTKSKWRKCKTYAWEQY